MADPVNRHGRLDGLARVGQRYRPSPDEGLLALATRRAIFEHVETHPGVHFSQLKRDLEVETGLLQHHLRELERHGLLESETHHGKRRVFVARELDDDERAILAVLRYETTRRILLHLLDAGSARNGELAEAVDVTAATISWHLANLADEGIVEAAEEGPATVYRVQDPDLTVGLLVRYRESFVDRAVDRIIDFWG